MNTFALFTAINVSATFRDASNGNLVDPTSVTLLLTEPNGTVDTVSAGIVRDGQGLYHYIWTPSIAGSWMLKYQGAGAVVASNIPVMVYIVS